jgi:predicted MPP superfamily phosphohydrolase
LHQRPREEQIIARLEHRLSPPHLRQRLGIEQHHERTFGHGARSFDLEDVGLARSLFCTALKLTGLHWLGSRYADRIAVRQNYVVFRNLPAAFDGFTMLHISDLHADMSERALRRLSEILPALSYDLSVLTGDYRGETFGPFDEALKEIAVLRPFLKGPVYGVLGNHDSIRMVPAFEDMGIQMLLNESVALHRGSDRLHLAGIDDAHFYGVHNFEKISGEIPDREFSILLSHTPEVYRQAAHTGFDLMLAGHTHGGQICLPGSYPIVLDSRLPRRFGAGAWTYNHMAGYTSVGVGSCIVPVRLNCPPEITLHHLKRATFA